jgi:type IV pilus assembly protein PilO
MARPAFLDTIATAPRWQRALFGAVLTLAFAAAGYLVGILPVQTRVTTLRMRAETQREEITRLQAAAAELARIRRQAAEVERQLEAAKQQLPTEREVPALYRTLSEAAVQAGLAVALFQPQAPRISDYYSAIPIAVVAEGRYHDVGDFIGRVAGLPRATMVSELKLIASSAETARAAAATAPRTGRPAASSSGGDASTAKRSLRAEMTLLTYVYRPVGSPPPPKPAGTPTKAEAAKP